MTSGDLAQEPIPGSAVIGLVSAGLGGFVRETLTTVGQDPSTGMPAAQVAKAYVERWESHRNGEVIASRSFAA